MSSNLILISYIVSAILFILGIKRLGKVNTARQGNFLSALGMLIAIIATMFKMDAIPLEWVIGGILIGTIIGVISATRIAMTSMPEMVAIFNGFGGGSSALVASAELFKYLNGKETYLTELTKNNSDLNYHDYHCSFGHYWFINFYRQFYCLGKIAGKN